MEHNSGLGSSLTDLMTSLMIVFVLLLVASLNNRQQEAVDLRDQVRIELERELKKYAGQGLQVHNDARDPLGLVVLVPEELLRFEWNKSIIPVAGSAFVIDFAPLLANTVCGPRFQEKIGSVIVEGHTDTSGTEEANLRLSQDRSMSVVRVMLDVLGASRHTDRTLIGHKCFLDLLSASGRGRSSPIVDLRGQEDAERSRRVIFKIRVKSLEERGLTATLSGRETR